MTSGSGSAFGIGLVVSLLAALWSASSGTGNLMKAVNLAYDEEETRGFLKLRGLALLLTVGAACSYCWRWRSSPSCRPVLAALPLGSLGTVVAQVGAMGPARAARGRIALAVVYRVAPDRDAPRFGWVSTGALVAAALWIIGSVGFSLYVNNFGSYNTTYGALAGVVVLLLWLYSPATSCCSARRSTRSRSGRPAATPPGATRSRWGRGTPSRPTRSRNREGAGQPSGVAPMSSRSSSRNS